LEDQTGAVQEALPPPCRQSGWTAVLDGNRPLYRAYLQKEQMRAAIAVKGTEGRALLGGWIVWAKRSRLPEVAKLANTMEQGLSNARSEATNTHLSARIWPTYLASIIKPDLAISLRRIAGGRSL
jgi:transposase